MRILKQVKNPGLHLRFLTDLLLNSPKCAPRFSPGYEGTENMFYFLNIPDHEMVDSLSVVSTFLLHSSLSFY